MRIVFLINTQSIDLLKWPALSVVSMLCVIQHASIFHSHIMCQTCTHKTGCYGPFTTHEYVNWSLWLVIFVILQVSLRGGRQHVIISNYTYITAYHLPCCIAVSPIEMIHLLCNPKFLHCSCFIFGIGSRMGFMQ